MNALDDRSPPSRPHHTEADGVPAPMSQRACRVAGTAAGAAIGSALGVFAGPVGVLAGALLGAALSALSGVTAAHENLVAHERDKELDAMIGISGGEIGAPPWSKRLPARISVEELALDVSEETEREERASSLVAESARPMAIAA